MIYVFVGSDSAYLKLQIRKNFMKTKVALEDSEFISFSGYEDLIQDVIFDVSSPSFIANKKIVVMDKCYFLSASTSKTPKGNDHYLEALKEYVENPDPINDLYLLVNDSLAKNELTNLLKKKCKVEIFNNPDDEELQRIVVEYYNLKNIKIDAHAVTELVKRVKGSYSLLTCELAKLENVGDTITLQDIDSLVHAPLEDNIFNLSTFMFQNKLDSALKLYNDLLKAGNDAYYLMIVMASQIRFMAAVSFGLSRYESEQTIAKRLSANPYRVTMTKRLVSGRRPEYFHNLLAQLFDIDKNFKLSNENLTKSLELFIINNTR